MFFLILSCCCCCRLAGPAAGSTGPGSCWWGPGRELRAQSADLAIGQVGVYLKGVRPKRIGGRAHAGGWWCWPLKNGSPTTSSLSGPLIGSIICRLHPARAQLCAPLARCVAAVQLVSRSRWLACVCVCVCASGGRARARRSPRFVRRLRAPSARARRRRAAHATWRQPSATFDFSEPNWCARARHLLRPGRRERARARAHIDCALARPTPGPFACRLAPYRRPNEVARGRRGRRPPG